MLRNSSSIELTTAILRETVPVEGTPAETYLMYHRIPKNACLRYHPSLDHPSGEKLPAIVVPVTNEEGLHMAIHLTFLSENAERITAVFPPTTVIGSAEGGAVRLAPPDAGFLVVGVRLNLCLRAMKYWRKPVWATLSLEGLAALSLPAEVTNLVIVIAGESLPLQSAHMLRERCAKEGRHARVRLLLPPDEDGCTPDYLLYNY